MNRLQTKLISDAPEDFWSLAYLKRQCELGHDDDDAYLTGLGQAAAAHLTGPFSVWRKSWILQEWCDFYKDFPNDFCKSFLRDSYKAERRDGSSFLRLGVGPVSSVSALKYIATDGVERVVDPAVYYLVDALSGGQVHLSPGASWPNDVPDRVDAVRVFYKAGFGDTAKDVPRTVVQAHAQLVAHWYAMREAVTTEGNPRSVPKTLEWLMRPYELVVMDHG